MEYKKLNVSNVMKCLSFECSQLGVELDLVTDVLDSSECPLK